MKYIDNYLNETHSQIIDWIGKCDTKASIVIALIGVVMPVLISCDTIHAKTEHIVKSFISYYKNPIPNVTIDWLGFTIIASEIVCVILLVVSLWFLFNVIISRSKISNENSKSLIFFGSISDCDLEKFIDKVGKMSDEAYMKDKEEQIHTCATICTKKHNNYNIGVKVLKWGMLCILLFLVLVIFYEI